MGKNPVAPASPRPETPGSGTRRFVLTERAAAELRLLLRRVRPGQAAVRIEAESNGTRLSCRIGVDHVTREGDIGFEQDGLPFRIDPSSLDAVSGATLDYVDTLHGAGFSFAPPAFGTRRA